MKRWTSLCSRLRTCSTEAMDREHDSVFKKRLKCYIFVQGLLLKWQEVLPTTESFTETLYQAYTANGHKLKVFCLNFDSL